jgi:cell division protein FtsZ
MDEIDVASNYIKGEVAEDAEIFWGVVFKEDMGDEVQIMVIATGIDKENYRKVVRLRDVTPEEASGKWTVKVNGQSLDEYDVPAYQRKKLVEEELPPEPIDEYEEPAAAKKGFFRRAFFKDDLDYPTFLRAKAD